MKVMSISKTLPKKQASFQVVIVLSIMFQDSSCSICSFNPIYRFGSITIETDV